jgi:glyoxalase superfamily protein
VTHYSRVAAIVIDVPDEQHAGELGFWRAASGAALTRYEQYPEYHGARLHGQSLGLLVQRLGDGEPRVHIDIHTDDLEAEVARLERLGAERVRRVNKWWVMRDPAGLMFCVVTDPPGSLTEHNAHRWD